MRESDGDGQGHDHDARDDGHTEASGRDRDRAAGPGDGDAEVTLGVPSMDCPSCAGTVGTALDRVDGVTSHDARPATGTVVVGYDPARTTVEDVIDAAEGAGYEVVDVSGDDGVDGVDGTVTGGSGDEEEAGGAAVWRSDRAVKTAVAGVGLALAILAEYALGTTATVATVLSVAVSLPDVLYLAAVVAGGSVILRGGYYSARNLSLDIDFLMSAAILAAVLASLISSASLYFEAATLAVLFNVAELLESHSMDRARGSLRELMDLSPEEATVRRDGEEVTVPVSEVAPGDVVVVRPGERIPMDGDVVEGESAVDESPITGESVPADKAPGDAVYAGTVNGGGYLEVAVTGTAGSNTLSRIVAMVQDAEANRTEREQFVDRFAGYYTPVMVAVAILVASVPPLLFGAPWVRWFVYGITMLVLACPCAFVISTPVSVVSAVTSAARNGVLIKGGDRLEAMGDVSAVAFDKTGTLTKGELAVTDVVPLNGHTEDDVLRCARGVEERSEHPIGRAIVAHAGEVDGEPREVSGFESLTGEGVRATLGETPHYAGKPALFSDLGFDLDHTHVVEGRDHALDAEVRDLCDRQGCLDLVSDTIPRLQAEGKTVVLVGREDELEGIIAVADEVRPGARRAVSRLRDREIEPVMLTGDNEETARAVAAELGIEEVRAGLLPEEKVDAVSGLMAEYDGVAMVGDGINDAPALATATVGIAMGAAGTDTALETADIALMGDDLSRLPYLYDLSAAANDVIRQNIWASLGVKAVLAAGVPLGLVSVALAVLAGDAGMTVGVTANAMRLSRISPDVDPGTE